jgi:hypothetical protein
MTRPQALLEARRRWGLCAVVYRSHTSPPERQCRVGTVARWLGVGRNWREAFERVEVLP